MAGYAIRDLERISGVKAHTLRIWEKRYGLLRPSRSSGNARRYDDEDLRRLLNVVTLNRHGYKISHIAAMDEAELQKNALAKASESANYEDRVDLLLEATLALDNQRWEHVFHSAVLSNGFEGAFIRVVFPFMEKLGILWIGGSLTPVHEHFASALVLRKLQVAIDGQLPRPKPDQPRFLLFLPEGEWHEIGLLFLHYLLRDRGAESFYLGSSLPINDVRSLLDEQDFDYVCLALSVMPARPELLQWLNELSTTFPNQDVIVLGRRVQDFDISEVDRVRLLTQTQEILGFVDFV